MEEVSFNTQALRQLIQSAFNDSELKVFCFDHFYDAYHDYIHDNMPLSLKAVNLADYCIRHGRVEKLLNLMEVANPYQYSRFKDDIFKKSSDEIHLKIKKILKEVEIVQFSVPKIDLEELSSNQRAGLIRGVKLLLSDVLNILENAVKILRMRLGSVILEVSIPTESIPLLLELEGNGHLNSLGMELGKQEVARLKKKLSKGNRQVSNAEKNDYFRGPKVQWHAYAHKHRGEQSLVEILAVWKEADETKRYYYWLEDLNSDERAVLWVHLSEVDKDIYWNLLTLYRKTLLWRRLPNDEQMRLWDQMPFQQKITFATKLIEKGKFDLWASLSHNARIDLFRKLPAEGQAQLWHHLSSEEQAEWWFAMSPDAFAILLWGLYPNQMVALLDDLPQEAAEFLIKQLSLAERASLVERVPEEQQKQLQWLVNSSI